MIGREKFAPWFAPELSAGAAAIGLAFWLAPVAAAGTLEEWTFDWGGALHGQVTVIHFRPCPKTLSALFALAVLLLP